MAELPEAVIEPLRCLDARGRRGWLVGESLHDLRLGRTVRAWEMATTASIDELLAAFPQAVLVDGRQGIAMLPTPAGPVDLATLRFGASPSDDLAHRDFTLLAQALDPLSGELCDPYSGERDRASGLLRCVGSAWERLAEDPLRALRAARLVAEQGYRADAELADAMGEIAPRLDSVARYRLRGELSRLLLAAHCRQGLALLRRTGIEAALVEGVREDAAALVAAVPAKLAIRLTAWLRGAGAAAFLRELRFGMPLSREVLLRLEHHPIEGAVRASQDPAVRRLLGRLDEEALEELFTLRQAELELPEHSSEPGGEEIAARRRSAEVGLAALRSAIERVRATAERVRRREALAIGGREVMQALGRGPGRHIGQALRYLGERVDEDPTCNERERLLALLAEWGRAQPD